MYVEQDLTLYHVNINGEVFYHHNDGGRRVI
jgi:hypothetical protein